MADHLYIPGEKTVRITPDLTERPMRIELPRNKRMATFVLALVSIWGAIGTVGLFHGLARLAGNASLNLVVALVLAFVVTLIAIYIGTMAMRHYVINDTVILHDDHLEVTTYSLFGKEKWQAPLSIFKGLRPSTRNVESSKGETSYQLIELVHPDPEKTLPIFLEKGVHPLRDQLFDLADRLGVPTLD